MTVEELVQTMKELLNDNTIPKNVKNKIEQIVNSFEKDKNGDVSLKANKALSILEEISEDVNLQPYTRTQIWNLISLLERIA